MVAIEVGDRDRVGVERGRQRSLGGVAGALRVLDEHRDGVVVDVRGHDVGQPVVVQVADRELRWAGAGGAGHGRGVEGGRLDGRAGARGSHGKGDQHGGSGKRCPAERRKTGHARAVDGRAGWLELKAVWARARAERTTASANDLALGYSASAPRMISARPTPNETANTITRERLRASVWIQPTALRASSGSKTQTTSARIGMVNHRTL